MNSTEEASTTSSNDNGGGFSSPVSLLSLVVLLGAVVAVLLVACFLYRRRQQRRLAKQLRYTERRIGAVADNLKARKEKEREQQRSLGGAAAGRISIPRPGPRPVFPQLSAVHTIPVGDTSMEAQCETAASLSSAQEGGAWTRGPLQRGIIASSAEYITHTTSAAPLRRTATLPLAFPLPPPNTPASSRGVHSASHHSTWGSVHSSHTISLTNDEQETYGLPAVPSSITMQSSTGGESNMDELSSDGGQVERWV